MQAVLKKSEFIGDLGTFWFGRVEILFLNRLALLGLKLASYLYSVTLYTFAYLKSLVLVGSTLRTTGAVYVDNGISEETLVRNCRNSGCYVTFRIQYCIKQKALLSDQRPYELSLPFGIGLDFVMRAREDIGHTRPF